MSDRSHRKHPRRRDSESHNISETKEYASARHRSDKRVGSSVDEERRRHRDSYSRRSDDPLSSKVAKRSSNMRHEHNIKSIGVEKLHLLSQYKNTTSDVEVPKETSTEGTDRDSEFSWEEHRSTLDTMFFQDENMIKKGSVEYDEFWIFLQKYQAFSRKQQVRSNLHSAEYLFQPNKFSLPETYDKQYRVNVSLLNKDVKGLLHHRRHRSPSLTEEKVATFHSILLHYIDFLQKQKFARLVKVKRDQQNLPIYEHRQEIIDAVARHQVVVVAGDTGCGKSTQVPQYLLSAGYTHIACTQPRRIACISLSRRVAYETLNEYGSEVAYQVCDHCSTRELGYFISKPVMVFIEHMLHK